MKKTIALILTLVLALGLVGSLTGCSSNKEVSTEKVAVCYVIANTANSKGLNLQSPLVQDTIYSTILNYGYISVVNADGSPEVVLASSFDIDEKYKGASDKLAMDARSKATNLISGMQTVIADDPEVDYLEALRLAVRSLASLEGYDSKQIIVLGTGLSTTGVLNFNNNLISAEPDVIVELLNEKSEIPNFSDITVYWQQLGDVAAPQETLTSAQKDKLQKIYGSLVETGGGTFVYNEIMANPVNESVEYPAVTPVDLPDDTPIAFEADELDTEDDKAFEEPQVLSESQVEFIGDQANYLYPDKAIENIRPIAEYLLKHDDVNIVLIGSTAGDSTNASTLKLSQERADAVKKTLIDLGVSTDRITTVGMGASDPWHIPNVGYDGAAASANRKVVLLDALSVTAQTILEQANS